MPLEPKWNALCLVCTIARWDRVCVCTEKSLPRQSRAPSLKNTLGRSCSSPGVVSEKEKKKKSLLWDYEMFKGNFGLFCEWGRALLNKLKRQRYRWAGREAISSGLLLSGSHHWQDCVLRVGMGTRERKCWFTGGEQRTQWPLCLLNASGKAKESQIPRWAFSSPWRWAPMATERAWRSRAERTPKRQPPRSCKTWTQGLSWPAPPVTKVRPCSGFQREPSLNELLFCSWKLILFLGGLLCNASFGSVVMLYCCPV